MTPNDNPPPWSIVIPAYNEEGRLGITLEAIAKYLTDTQRRAEILVVDDGSTDATARLAAEHPIGARVLPNPGNRGKGYSVRAGLRAARGDSILFTDADLSTPIEEWPAFEKALAQGADVAIASRALPLSRIEIHQAWWREQSGRMFNRLVRLISGLPYMDTQCGFKAYRRRAARRIAGLQRLEGWAFDVEQLRIAQLLDMRVVELPVRWIDSPATKVRFLRDAPRMLLDTLKVRLMRYDSLAADVPDEGAC